MKNLLKLALKLVTKLVIKRYDPYIIAITGTVGKTSTKEAMVAVLSDKFNTRGSAGNLNTEFGAPLVFLKQGKAGESYLEWASILLKGVSLLVFRDKDYPEIIVSEIAADKPGDIEYLCSVIKPHISVITAVGEVPVHVEFYNSVEEVAKEKAKLAFAAKDNVFLCFDDPLVREMGEGITFGFEKEADVYIHSFEHTQKGVSFAISHNKKDHRFHLPLIGKPAAYSFAAAFAVASYLGLEDISSDNIFSPPGRMSLLEGIKETMIIDGSYNAAPASVFSALECLEDFPAKRRLAVLGDMLELGEHSLDQHRKVGERARSVCDIVISVGELSREMNSDYHFQRSEDVASFLPDVIKKGDVVLVKGSQSIRTEKVVYSIMKYPQKAEKLLVRQTSYWRKKDEQKEAEKKTYR